MSEQPEFAIGDRFSTAVPAEPPNRSIVITETGDGWQRLGKKWLRTGHVLPLIGVSIDGLEWPELLARCGSVSLVHIGVDPTSKESKA